MKEFRVVADGKAMGDLGVADSSNASVTVTFEHKQLFEWLEPRFVNGEKH